jgi:hypothetical protein
MLCILLPAGSNPTQQPNQPSAPVPERGRAFLVVRSLLPPPSKQMRGGWEPRQFARVFARAAAAAEVVIFQFAICCSSD